MSDVLRKMSIEASVNKYFDMSVSVVQIKEAACQAILSEAIVSFSRSYATLPSKTRLSNLETPS